MATRLSTKTPTAYTKEKTGYTQVCLWTASIPFHGAQQQDGGADVKEEEAWGWRIIKAEQNAFLTCEKWLDGSFSVVEVKLHQPEQKSLS